jgi:hypothetical protein
MNDRRERPLQVNGLPVLSTGLNLAELDLHGGEGFWDEVRRYTSCSRIDHQIDQTMGGRAAPRIWALFEAPESGHSAAAAALAMAWVLADRGQMVVLVDADEKTPWITRWLGRTEQEGWIDMVRFGASLQSSSVSLPSDTRRGAVLGVGSFSPTGITPDEVTDLLTRLRRQADDLVLVLPAKLRSLPWLEMAHIRLLCWDVLSRSTGDTEKILAEVDRMGVGPHAILGFGVEEFILIQSSLQEEELERTVPDESPEDSDVLEDERQVEQDPEPTVTSVDETAAAQVSDETFEDQDGAAAEGGRPGRRTSRIFLVIAAAAVLTVVMLGFFLRTQLGPSMVDEDPLVAGRTPSSPIEPVEADQLDVGLNEQPIESDMPAAARDTMPSLLEPDHGDDTTGVIESSADSTLDSVDTEPMDRTPYRREPGQDGWALWLFSVPDERGAEAEVSRLGQLGIQAIYKRSELADQTIWWRIYAGSYSSRAEAQAAAGPLLTELKHDWAMPVRF